MHEDEPIGKIYEGNTEEENNGYESLNENSKDQQVIKVEVGGGGEGRYSAHPHSFQLQ